MHGDEDLYDSHVTADDVMGNLASGRSDCDGVEAQTWAQLIRNQFCSEIGEPEFALLLGLVAEHQYEKRFHKLAAFLEECIVTKIEERVSA